MKLYDEDTKAAAAAQHCVTAVPLFSSPPFHNLVKQCSDAFSTAQRSIASAVSQIHILASTNPVIQNLSKLPQVSFRPRTKLDNLSHHSFAAILPGDSVAGLVAANGILNFLNIYNTLLVARLVLTWFPNAPPVIVSPLSTLCDPYLNIFRGIIPPLGGTLDLSPILAFVVLNAFTSTASALPAELPSGGEHADGILQTPGTLATRTQKKWMKRLAANQKISSEK